MYFCRRKFGQPQLTSSYLNILIDSKNNKGTLFALQLVQLQFKPCSISFGIRDHVAFSVGVSASVFPIHTPPPPFKDVVIMRWMSSDTMKLKREKLIQHRSLIFFKRASCWLCNIIRKLSREKPVKCSSEPIKIIFSLVTGLINTWSHYPFLLFNTSVLRYVNYVEYLGSTSLPMCTARRHLAKRCPQKKPED